ncbi:MAG: argininosuccinate lyase [Rhodospirillaceae bacterium TMED8]|nr:argininosuccinate lyase [Magnetovibrio sp.]OUT49880.1 MAG: argininosuccinate lyase [Rhodospirillaceae bacterium TMED8]|tara:strand:+ start:2645 stop:4054 length:1410 start_codon:yes stop_codon:yes gene_type:complete
MANDKLKSSDEPSLMWGGRFSRGQNSVMEAINASVDFDKRMYAQDIRASQVHARMLGAQGIIKSEDANAIVDGLNLVKKEIEKGDFSLSSALEDIHMNVEARLAELIGEPAGRLHTGRSRNDQVATDFKLWVRDALDALDENMRELQCALIDVAEVHAESVMPGFTHMQSAQPVTLGHHMLAYTEMIGRDRGRAMDCRKRLNENPLGAAALAGTSFPIDRDMTTKELDFDRPAVNSMDAVSDRDFALEFLSFGAILSTHLSRLAEEYVIWCSQQFAYVALGDAFSTGSSIMPQKRNPDAAELIRAKAGRVIGALNGLLIVMKGLPMTYGKDMQEDKEPVFEVFDTLKLSLLAMTGILGDSTFNIERMATDAGRGFATATDLADWLVRSLAMPFREAHKVTGGLVKMAEEKNCGLENLSLEEMQTVEAGITDDIYSVLSVDNALASRKSYGGAAPHNVSQAVKDARLRFL